MENCKAFAEVHPEGEPTNMSYFNDQKAASTRGQSGTKSVGSPPAMPEEAIASMNVRALKEYISTSGLDHSDCIEKAELQARAREASEKNKAGK